MLHIGNEYIPLCSGSSRRSFLQFGAAAMTGMTLANLFKLQAAGAVDDKKAKIRNCITLFLGSKERFAALRDRGSGAR